MAIVVTFFMIVTDRDVVVADYAVRSYARIKDVPFKLVVYSNWVSSDLKKKYFPVWRQLPYVEIIENEWQVDDEKPADPALEGPFEHGSTIWPRELKKIRTPYHATVDADFEILDPEFVTAMLARMGADPRLVAMSTDYSPRNPKFYDSYIDEVICLNERWHTWFCVYKCAALECATSYDFHEEIAADGRTRNSWDYCAYFQKALKEVHGYELAALEPRYQRQFIHYGAFSKNRHINEDNVSVYRRLMILRKRGLFGRRDVFTRLVCAGLLRLLFWNTDRSKFLDGFGGRWARTDPGPGAPGVAAGTGES